MKHDESHPLEQDPVWDLLRQSPRAEARPSFVDDVLRAARLEAARPPWWQRFRLPLAAGGLTAAAAAVALALTLPNHGPEAAAPVAGNPATPAAVGNGFDELDEALRTETLLVAAEHPSEFSDDELVTLLTF